MRASTTVLGVQVTAMKQFGACLTNCNPIVEEQVVRIKDRDAPSISFAVSVLRGVRRAMEEITGAIDVVEAAHGEAYRDESTGLLLDPKKVDDAVKEVVDFM